ncbi:tRNA(fMet)-specific endonuclease VapC [Methylobacterium cerastii]|uniref:Ribonuclease VapC n=1 Tax=Methylobacterium cerastii TaxID=932741 RepID=A0ABQ4QM03_9HYPH|nr:MULTISPECIES: type II toxin-antitoxin system VapC family toxin [Methylobacterium]TXN09356.1 type II toxin-antitoxin system VapC family toxin [Methylobacterium sp. WL122]TXN82785.1 type II toxin-antitoxin system VapC family toxin [Methylobacterium sp. WL8]GJD46202.1 tRNA(fMet)-specific endonuclease VapC [Methylobacterium cerastii]
MILVVDASVIVKWYIREEGSDGARRLLSGPDLLVTPTHAAAEIGHVLTRHVRAGALPRDETAAALAGLSRTASAIPLGVLHAEAIAVAVDAGTSFYDALYVAAAAGWNTRVVTADLHLVRTMSGTPWAAPGRRPHGLVG